MIKNILSILVSGILFISTSCYADDQPTYGSEVGNKALNGFANMTTGVLEIPKNIINTSNDSNIAYGFIGGLAKGILNSAGRIVTGMTDFVTAPLPTQPIVYPAYIWDDFDTDTSYGPAFRLQE